MRKLFLFVVLALILFGMVASVDATPRPVTRPIVPTATPIRQVCRPNGFCYRPDPPPQYTPTPFVCNPPPGCNPAVESCAAACYPLGK